MPQYDIDGRNSRRARSNLAKALKRFDGVILDEGAFTNLWLVCVRFESDDATEEALTKMLPGVLSIKLSAPRRRTDWIAFAAEA